MFEPNVIPLDAGLFSTQTSFPKNIITTRPSLATASCSSLYMINPFNTNNDQYLFRKNYNILHRPSPEPPQPYPHSPSPVVTSLRNPFTSTHNISMRNSSVVSPQRATSVSRALSPQSRFGGRRGLLEAADGWKRELESK